MCYLVTCHLRNKAGIEFPGSYLGGFLAGLCVLMEAKGKRIEFAMYCLPRALESFWYMMVDKKYARQIR